jgi:Protein of unknown function (DUF3037)
MKTFYSLIKISPNPSAGDLLTIGIIVVDQSGVIVKVSDNKLKLSYSTQNENSALIEFIVKQIKKKVEEVNNLIPENTTLLFENIHLFNPEYFEYLNRYSNNLIQFTKPIALYDNMTPENINKLFNLFVDTESHTETKLENNQETIFDEKIEKKLLLRVKNRVHTNIWFDDTVIPSLYFHFKMDCIGLNGVFTGAKSLYFNKSQQTIHTQVSDYITLITEIEKKYNRETKNNFYLIADEPNKGSKEHLLWEKIHSLTKIKLIISDDIDEVAELIEKNDAKTFLSPIAE